MRNLLLAFGAVCVLAGCGPATTTPAFTPADSTPAATPSPTATAQRCGLERWAVKTGTDPSAALIDLHTVTPSTVAQLTAIPAPAALPAATRVKPVEVTVYQVTATLTEFKTEADHDIHLVLTDGGRTMIAEIPDPACVAASSPLLPGITTARAAFDARYHPSDVWQHPGVQVTVTGVGFFDSLHGQTGVAGNGIELHPVLSLKFGSGP